MMKIRHHSDSEFKWVVRSDGLHHDDSAIMTVYDLVGKKTGIYEGRLRFSKVDFTSETSASTLVRNLSMNKYGHQTATYGRSAAIAGSFPTIYIGGSFDES